MLYRIYTGEDGQSHMEEYSPPVDIPATGIIFRSHEPGNFIDWHVAPRKQFIITLEGQVEIGLGDGTVYTLGPGDMMLAEDLTGQVNTRKSVVDKTRVSIAIPVE